MPNNFIAYWRIINFHIIGVYSQSTGVEVVREDVAQYIEQRDQLSANPQNIFLSNGASEAVKVSMITFIVC